MRQASGTLAFVPGPTGVSRRPVCCGLDLDENGGGPRRTRGEGSFSCPIPSTPSQGTKPPEMLLGWSRKWKRSGPGWRAARNFTSPWCCPGSSRESCRPEEPLRPRTCTVDRCSTVELDMDTVISENCPADVSSTLQLCHTGLVHPAGWPVLSSMYALGQGSTFEPQQKDYITATVSTCRVCCVVSGTLF